MLDSGFDIKECITGSTWIAYSQIDKLFKFYPDAEFIAKKILANSSKISALIKLIEVYNVDLNTTIRLISEEQNKNCKS
jgi:hypothetical protein